MFTNGNSDYPGSGAGYGIAAGLASAGASFYDTYQSNKTARENTDKTIAANKAEAELAYQRQIQMWNMQNEYNTPSAQMARFKAAGLNPHLVYGQGNPGNSSSPPAYQPPRIQYQYEAGRYGQAFQSVLPVLMSVGSWMQDMRLKEAQLSKTQETTTYNTLQQEQLRQLIDFLREKNPRMLEQLDNTLSLFPYQRSIQQDAMVKSDTELARLNAEYRFQYGDDLWSELKFRPSTPRHSDIGGMKRLQFIQQAAKTRLDQAKASWTDYSVTNPQAIMQLVLSGVMGLAGQTLRFNRKARSIHETESRMSTGRVNIRRRIYEK